jgi:hypothetical protein
MRIRRMRRAIGSISMTVPTVARNPARRAPEPGAAAAAVAPPPTEEDEVDTKKRSIAIR